MPQPINSEGYWDSRFHTDWESMEGPRQSRFFSRVALELMPPWLLHRLQQDLTLADWGCAQGDGTAVFVEHMPASRITGIDFSPVAVAQATDRYPHIGFRAEDWLAGTGSAGTHYDVVFSSNTLEHFHQPFDALAALAARADKAVVLALPYRELERIDEHFFTFTPANLPLSLASGHTLVWARVADCRAYPGALWNGEQVVLVYAQPDWFAGLRLPLAAVRVEHDDPRRSAAVLAAESARDALRSELDAAKQARLEEQREAAERARQHRLLEDERAALLSQRDTAMQELEASRARLGTAQSELRLAQARHEMLSAQSRQVSDWAQRMDAAPLRYGMKRHAYRAARAAWRGLPIGPALRQRLRQALGRLPGTRAAPADTAGGPHGGAAPLPAPWPVVAERAAYRAVRDVFVFGVIDWHFRIQRPQHLARGLARQGRRVFYVSSQFVDAADAGYRIERLDADSELYLVHLHVAGAPAIYFADATPDALRQIQRGMARLIGAEGATSSVSLLQHAYWWPVALSLPNSLRVYDCMDHHEGFGNVPAELIAAEQRMLRGSDLVVVSSAWLEAHARGANPSVAVVRNAGEFAHFADRPATVFDGGGGRRVIGYYGAIAEWFDVELVRAVARAHRDCLVLLVGNDTIQAARALSGEPNVRFTGEVQYAELPRYLWAFDVCLLPFQVIPLTLATNPVKVYEYLAAGRPVVSVDLPEMAQFGDLVQVAPDAAGFVARVAQALTDPQAPQQVAARRAFAQAQTWDHRAAALASALDDLRLPLVSVVVLTYNNLALTQACLDSLLQDSDYPALEIVVVDNASTDGTPDWLRTWQQQHPQVRVLLNDENLGFAAGNNVGLAAARGDYLVLLNNDTVVTRGWVLTLLRHLQADAQAGLVGPVTNNIGNEARIPTAYGNDLDAMRPEALRHTLAHMGQRFGICTAAFFCVMLPRAVYEACGPVCEDYGLGFFEDDDYCRRVEATGRAVRCADDVFVHHHLSASFGQLPSRDRQTLFQRNRAIYESRWGGWSPHSYDRQPPAAGATHGDAP